MFKGGAFESRSCELLQLKDMHIFLDRSSIEVFINGGEEVFTARFFANPDNQSIVFEASGQVEMFVEKWELGE